MEEVSPFASTELLIVANDNQTEENRRQTKENRRGIKATPYVKMDNFILTPDSETPDSPTDQETSSPQKNPSQAVWTTPKSRHTIGIHIINSRRINFDLPEDEEKAEDLNK